MPPDFEKLYVWLKRLGMLAIAGVVLLICAGIYQLRGDGGPALIIPGILAIMPIFLFTYCITILHWKHRYIGKKSTLWGVLLMLESSGWFKVVYLFRHLLPDIRGTGRYRKSN